MQIRIIRPLNLRMPLYGGRNNMIAATIYLLCTFTAFFCAWMLFRSYKNHGYRLLLWSGLCFSCLFINNILLVCDKIIFPTINFKTIRLSVGLLPYYFYCMD